MTSNQLNTSAYALLSVFAANGIDRAFLVPGESFLGVLDAFNELSDIDLVTCRHESGAGFMACADGRLTGRPGVALVSRGPGATNAAIAVHTAQQDAIPMILIVGQIPKEHLRKGAFQEIDYQQMFGQIAKWVVEPTDPQQLSEAAFKALRVATTGTPGPVVIVLPEDVQQQIVPVAQDWVVHPHATTTATPDVRKHLVELIAQAQRPLIIAGGAFDCEGGREALLEFAQTFQIPVALSFRRHDVFPNTHALYVGDLGLANRPDQMQAFHSSDLILALGTRLDDITTQSYTFPQHPKPVQTLVHCYPDDRVVGQHFSADVGLVCDPVSLVRDLVAGGPSAISTQREQWIKRLRQIQNEIAAWPLFDATKGIECAQVVQTIEKLVSRDAIVCLDAGTFAAPVYRHFQFVWPQRLMAPLSGAMGYGVPAAVASQLRHPDREVVCLVGDGGFMMTGNEMIMAIKRRLPITFVVMNNDCYGSIQVQQDIHYPGRRVGTSLFNPDFSKIASGFNLPVEVVTESNQVDAALERALRMDGPSFVEIRVIEPVAPRPGAED